MVLPGSSEQQFDEDRSTLLKLGGLLAVLMFGGWLWLVAWMRAGSARQQSVRSSEADTSIAETVPQTVRR